MDMTLAADGHLVKAHQVLVALASPYLKDMIVSAPCPHPVIYLNVSTYNVSSFQTTVDDNFCVSDFSSLGT